MEIQLKDLVGKHQGKPALVCGHGPSLDSVKPRLEELRGKGYILLECNEWYSFHSVYPDYWVVVDNIFKLSTDKMNELAGKTVVLNADSIIKIDKEKISKTLTCDHLFFDTVHLEGKPRICCTSLQPCSGIIPGRKTIQEEVMAFTGYDKPYGSGFSTPVHQTALAIILGCNPIYVVGVELDYRLGYAKNDAELKIRYENEFDGTRHWILEDFRILRESGEKKGIEIFNLNQNSSFDTLKIKPSPA